MRKIKTTIWLLLTVTVISASNYPLSQADEYLIKTAYIEKFARFTEWPDDLPKDRFVICVLGKSPFNGALELLASNYKIKNKRIQIRYTSSIDEIDNCNILFICKSEKNKINEILKNVIDRPVLTVGDTNGFAEKGVHFNFYLTEEGTIHFEVNPASIAQAGLKCDMFLLGVGKIIY